jgi:hypothetical protein
MTSNREPEGVNDFYGETNAQENYEFAIGKKSLISMG